MKDMNASDPLLKVRDLKVWFSIKRDGAMPWTPHDTLKAVDGVDFELMPGETLGIVGESGCGKSTLARAIMRMVPAEAGTVMWLGDDLLSISKRQMNAHRKEMQMIFQDPLASLNPRMTIGQIVAEPLKTHFPNLKDKEVKQRVREVLDRVGILPNMINRYPHEFSGGQCQRIGIARALVVKPKMIICDEPVSALDVSIQAQVINLLMELQEEMGLSLIFIAHDLSVVKHISTRVMVLYLGNVMEISESDQLYRAPGHPYTEALISAVPIPDPKAEASKEVMLLDADLPSPLNPPSGCVFRTRCPHAKDICAQEKPMLTDRGNGQQVACHLR
ncbi:murein tripeptide/oligopeptide ABC transporter ATP binding protein OppF [Aliiroseovarius sp. KMU-50]|uniref:Murein tripeptide/oligopeptide ABC transporter ATP binding protein OppF n=1 Tax=Aliiroseovarius salicola TaxID=3009082 RepID=A0ABT4W0Q8_9RHOB|nr:murein tripeptide/oligopeptide ABC transporter ATP binding protein OppF [Aliiroseovarius sp. KMU-50]MDA5093422.1 murein tripeptide/oligopeptide ABC transporter ATP binding protein OppF [Aliiroseovarius sp. KMU-50]